MNKIIDLKNGKGLIVLDKDINIKGLVEKEHETLKRYLDEKDPCKILRTNKDRPDYEWNLDYITEYMLVGKCSIKDLRDQSHILKFKMYLIDIDYYKDNEKEGFIFDLNKTKRRFLLENGKMYRPSALYNSDSFKIEELELSLPNQEQLKMLFKDFKINFNVEEFNIFFIEKRSDARYITHEEYLERFANNGWFYDGDVVYDKDGEYYLDISQQSITRLGDAFVYTTNKPDTYVRYPICDSEEINLKDIDISKSKIEVMESNYIPKDIPEGFKNCLVNSKRREFIAGVYYGDNEKC